MSNGNYLSINPLQSYQHYKSGLNDLMRLQSAPRLTLNLANQRHAIFCLLLVAFLLLLVDCTWAVTIEGLKEPIVALKNEIFGGWMQVVKICAATSGIIMSAFRCSLTPFGIGAGLSAGIHLYDSYLGTGAAGALI